MKMQEYPPATRHLHAAIAELTLCSVYLHQERELELETEAERLCDGLAALLKRMPRNPPDRKRPKIRGSHD